MKNENPGADLYKSRLAPALAEALRPGGLALTEQALLHCAFPRGAALLDIGCGAGATVALARKKGYACLGVDTSAAMLKAARKNGLAGFVQAGDAAALPFADAAFDGALLECSLSAMGPHDPVLAEASRVLKNDGRLIISDLSTPETGRQNGPLPPDIDWAAYGLALLFTEDHTKELSLFYVQMVFALGSRTAADKAFGCGEGTDPKELRYMLWILNKKDACPCG